MAAQWPTFGEVQEYLRGLGFQVGPGMPGYVVCEHPEDSSWFVFRDRDLNTPARESELLDMKVQLPGRGFVTDEEYARFWNQGMQPAAQPTPAMRDASLIVSVSSCAKISARARPNPLNFRSSRNLWPSFITDPLATRACLKDR